MVYSHIKDGDDFLVGTIDHIKGVCWVLWRESAKGFPGRVQRIEPRIYRTLEDARQAVYRARLDVMVVPVK